MAATDQIVGRNRVVHQTGNTSKTIIENVEGYCEAMGQKKQRFWMKQLLFLSRGTRIKPRDPLLPKAGTLTELRYAPNTFKTTKEAKRGSNPRYSYPYVS